LSVPDPWIATPVPPQCGRCTGAAVSGAVLPWNRADFAWSERAYTLHEGHRRSGPAIAHVKCRRLP
jgi:hypothetical protein